MRYLEEIMSTIGSVSSVTTPSYIKSAYNGVKHTGGDSDGDNENSRGAGRVGRGSNFMQAIVQALGQSLGVGSSPSTAPVAPTVPAASASGTTSAASANQDPAAAVQAFMHDLFSALHQGQHNQGSAQTANSTSNPSTSSTTTGGQISRSDKHSGNMAAKLQNLLQQLSANNQTDASGSSSVQTTSTSTTSTPLPSQGNTNDPLSKLNASFQNMINSLKSLQGSTPTQSSMPTLQSFLQNLIQNLSNGQNIAGSVISTTA
jgi:hypothetical protein